MEKALFITNIAQLTDADDMYTRLYYGNEFCERLIPSLRDLQTVIHYTKQSRLAFSLVSPCVTNSGLEELQVLFEYLKSEDITCEVIVNDWGVLSLVNSKYRNLIPVLGRLLTKQKRGPRIISLLKREVTPRLMVDYINPGKRTILIQKPLPSGVDPYYKGSNTASVPIIHDFLISQRISRIELDNTEQGLSLALPKDKIGASVYVPYVYISTTFYCLTAGCEEKEKSLLRIRACAKECQRYIFKLRHRTMPKIIYLRGNTQFYKNARLRLREYKHSGVNRIVYQPHIPM
ncbi:MAG: hypothetical protein JW938_01535 [Candidatus Omnitrophica bacterium]|nr:hypothetical protein [Candidatus Omnitrophota bacterium]